MKLSDFSQSLIGKSNKEDTVFFFFPNIPSWNKNLLDMTIKNNSSSTLDNIININFSNKIRKNTPSIVLIENLLKFKEENGNDINRLSTIVFIEYQNQVDRINISNRDYYELLKKILDTLYQEGFTDIYYLQIIYTYLINKKYDITLFLLSCMLVLSPIIKNSNNEKFENFQNIIKFIKDFTNYEKYLQKDSFLTQDYIPPKKYTDTLICTNTHDESTRSFYSDILNDISCKELNIMSINAQNWIINNNLLYKLQDRLNQGLIVKILIMDKTTSFYNLYTNNNYVFTADFKYLQSYPNIEIKYTNIPLTNRIVEDVTHKKMRVDFLITPNDCSDNLSIFLEQDNFNTAKYYNKYSEQFMNIWNNSNYSYNTSLK